MLGKQPIKKVFDVPGGGQREVGQGRAIGSREYDHYDAATKTGYEFNASPWSQMNLQDLQTKLDFKVEQLNKDIVLMNSPGTRTPQVQWYMTESLPTTGQAGKIAAPLRNALEAARKAYRGRFYLHVVR
jgi:hypothetical protein